MIAGCKYGNVVNLMSILTLILKAFDARVRNIWVRTGRRKSRDSPARARSWSAAVRARRSASESAETSGSMALMRATVSAYFFRVDSPSSRPPPPNTPPRKLPTRGTWEPASRRPCIPQPRRLGWNRTRNPPQPPARGEARPVADGGWGKRSEGVAAAEA